MRVGENLGGDQRWYTGHIQRRAGHMWVSVWPDGEEPREPQDDEDGQFSELLNHKSNLNNKCALIVLILANLSMINWFNNKRINL